MEETENYSEAVPSTIELKTSAKKCMVCKSGDVVPDDKTNKEGRFVIYTRNGTLLASHRAYR